MEPTREQIADAMRDFDSALADYEHNLTITLAGMQRAREVVQTVLRLLDPTPAAPEEAGS